MATPHSTKKKYKFITEPDESFTCKICLELARDPWQHGKCGMLFCEECLEKYGRVKACPHCKRDQPQYFEDNKSQREIQNFRVRCDNVADGCEWVGTVNTLDDHVTEVCQFIGSFPCPNQKCQKTLMGRMEFEEHKEECDYGIVSCKYEYIGCDAEMERKDMRVHEKDNQLHLQLSLDTLVELRRKFKILAQDFKTSLLVTNSLQNGMIKTVKVKKVLTIPQSTALQAEIRPGGYYMCLACVGEKDLNTGTQKITIGVEIATADYEADPFTGTITVEILNQLADENHYKITFTPKEQDNGLFDTVEISPAELTAVEKAEYLKDGDMFLRVSAETCCGRKPWLECDAHPLTRRLDGNIPHWVDEVPPT